jgi:amino acid adenylation domain-containing protein
MSASSSHFDADGAVALLDCLPQSTCGHGRDPEMLSVALPLELAQTLRSMQSSSGLEPCMVGLAAWLVVLDRVTGHHGVRVALHGGSRHGLLEVSIGADVSSAQWLASVRRSCEHLSSDPVLAGSAWLLDPRQPFGLSLPAPLCVGIEPGGELLIARIGSPSMAPSGVRALLESLMHVIQQLVGAPAAMLSSVSAVLSEDAQRCTAWNEQPWPYDGPRNVVDRFVEVAQRFPGSRALAWRGGELTYAAVEAESRSVATALLDLGVRSGDVVAVSLDRSPRAIVAILGVLRAGAAYLPLDVSFPPERVQFMLDDAQVGVAISQPELAERLPPTVRVLSIDALPVSRAVGLPRVDADALAYLMYTSGSTGTPKGVQIAHRSIVRLVCDATFMKLDRDVVMLHAAPLGFDASTLEIWGPLLNGGCCVLHHESIPSGEGLAATIREKQVSAAWLTAALFNAVVDDDPRHLAGLSELLIGGETLSVDHVSRFMQAVPGTALINGYGPTECTTFTTTHRIDRATLGGARSIPIGRPITDTQLYILNARGEEIPVGLIGELYVGGSGVAKGYLRRPDLTAERFVQRRCAGADEILYRTGDLVRYLDDGVVEFIGRADGQVKIRGFRIEPGEIETALATHPDVRACAVIAREDADRGTQLVAYVVPSADAWQPTSLRERLAQRLPDFMVPAHYVRMSALPVTPNGKLDRRALPEPRRERPAYMNQPLIEPRAGLEQAVADAFGAALGLEAVGALDNFFDLGGSSLLIMRAHATLRAGGHGGLTVAMMFSDPTARGIARMLQQPTTAVPAPRRAPVANTAGALDAVAIVGMAGRFPGAPDIESFWKLLDEGRDAIRVFRADELDASIPAALRADPAYVSARGVIDGVDLFDAGFFGISPNEAELMDPQQRVFLELCWECLERAGQVPEKTTATIGVFAGMYNASYFQRHVLCHPEKIERVGEFQVMLANEKDYIATRVAHKLNLTGPAVSVHTACSTSLVAIAQAFDALRAGQCGLALAGGSSITCPPNTGYLYQDGAMLSPDGHTRTFDSAAQGTVFSDGAAVVLLKRLADALADGNTIHAVIRGAAINNDGARKASFTAPSVEGQAAVVSAALDNAGVDARSISYVEAHGTATPLGDPVEVAALTQAFRRRTLDQGFCAIGSVKSNTGHMVVAAGAAGVIKTALALSHERLPVTVHFQTPNPKIEFATSPFVVQAHGAPWPRGAQPRRAGVSSFGVGGTNAHAILEEAPLQPAGSVGFGSQLLRLSARSKAALEAATERLAAHLEQNPDLDLADVAHTLDVGRRDFGQRTFVVAASATEAVAALRATDGARARIRPLPSAEPAPVLMFPGQGAQYPGMGRDLYTSDPAFRRAFDECLAALQGHVPFDLRALMFADDPAPLAQTAVTQPATFCLEYALARAWLARGLEPVAMVGHSVGEFVAAAVAGVMPLEAAVRLVALRGALMQALPAGAMLSVRLGAAALEPLLPPELQLAAENGPTACVVSGPSPAIDAFAALLAQRDVVTRLLQTSHAFHSAMMDPALPEFEAAVRAIPLAVPTMRIVSTVTGSWLTDAQATSSAYWARHLREPVRFSQAVRTLLADQRAPLFLEAGPRATLTALVRLHRSEHGLPLAVASLADDPTREYRALAEAAGHLWALGAGVRWHATPPTGRRRVVLPSYPFERQRHWVDAVPRGAPIAAPAQPPAQLPAPVRIEPISLPVNPPTEAAMTASANPVSSDRRPALVQRLRTVFEDVSGVDLAGADAAASFVELGLDSLTLTQVALQLKKAFAMNITFRQLMETHRSFDALAAFLDDKLPAQVAPVVAAASAPPVIAAMPAMAALSPSAAGASYVQQVIQQQMQLMAQQLALLQGQGAAAMPDAMPSAPAQIAAAPAAAPTVTASTTDGDATLAHRTYDVKKAFGAIARIHTAGTELTARQRARLDAFMRRYIEKTRRSKDYTIEHRSHMADPRVVNGFRPMIKEIIYQIVVQRSKGSRMWDLDGNEYVDVLNGFGMNMFGWQPDFVVDAVRKQLDNGYDIGPQHPLAGEVCKLLCELTGFDRAGLCNTGSEAVMAAIRIARTVTGRSTLVLFTGSYHGTFDEVLVRAGRGGKGISAAPGVMSGMFGDVRVLDYGTPEALEFIRANADDLAAVLVEPVQSRRPDFQPREFLEQVRAITERSGTCLIFDEVITGFRSHLGGAQAVFGIRADLACYGKVIGGGFPVGAVAGKRDYMDALDGGGWQYGDDSMPTVGVTYFAGTFVRHPLALAAAKASLDHLKQRGPQLQSQLNERTAAMADELSAFCRELGAPLEIRHFASMWRVSWLEDHPLQDLLFAMMRSRGVHILDNFPCFFTTAHTEADIQLVVTAFKDSVRELQESDFLPRHKVPVAMVFDASKPPVPGARLGKDAEGRPAWFVRNPAEDGKYMKVNS